MIHAANADKSNRLQRVLRLLSDGKQHSTLEVQQRAKVCNAHTCKAELKANGYEIDCKCIGRGRFVYRLVGRKEKVKAV
jgi:hypothetical protein